MKGLFDTPDTRLRSLSFMGLVLGVLAGVLCQLLASGAGGLPLSDSWAVLAVDRSLASRELHEHLAGNGFPDCVSEFNVQAMVSSFGFTRWQGLRAFLLSVPADDVRLTPWLKDGLLAFHDRDGRYSLWYLPLAGAALPSGLSASLSDLLGSRWGLEQGRDWFLLERSGSSGWTGPVLYGAGLVILLCFAPAGTGIILATALLCLPWVLQAALGSVALLLAVLLLLASLLELLLPAFRRFARDDDKGLFPWDCLADPAGRRAAGEAFALYGDLKALGVRGLVLLGFVLLTAVAGTVQTGLPATLGLVLVLTCLPLAILMAYAGLLQSRRQRFEHRLFVPVPIMSRSNVLHSRLRRAIPWLGGLWCLAILVTLAGVGGGPGPAGEFPAIVQSGAPVPALKTLRDLWPHGADRDSRQAGLPGLREYLVNQAWQDCLPWLDAPGRQGFQVPEYGAFIDLPRYDFAGGAVTTSRQHVASFDDEWLDSLVRGLDGPAGTASVEGLLLAGGRPGQLVYQRSDRIYSTPDWLLVSYGTTGAFFLLLWFRGRHATNRQWYDARSTFTQVRKQAV